MNGPDAPGGRVVRRPGEPDVHVASDPEGASRIAAAAVVDAIDDAVRARGRADWATTGGSAPGAIYRILAASPTRERVAWMKVHLWFGDDRFVPSDHALSNARIAFELLLARSSLAGLSGSGMMPSDVTSGERPGAPIPPSQVHAFPTADAIARDETPDWCAGRYADELRSSGVATGDGWPAFDLLLLGIGPDGHLLSVFPGSAAFTSRDWALGIPAPTHVEPHVPRVTLNPGVVEAARTVLVVVHGASKAAVVGRVFGPRVDPTELPAQLARRPSAVWVLDEAAAAELP